MHETRRTLTRRDGLATKAGMTSSLPQVRLNLALRYRLEVGVRARLGQEARALGMSHALVVTDPGVFALPWFAPMIEGARDAGLRVTLYADVHENPDVQNVLRGAAVYREASCDGVILVGGGSAMDAGKAIALAATHEGPLLDYAFGASQPRRIDASRMPPMLAMPTTAGTGSEVSSGSIVVDEQRRVKRSLVGYSLVPSMVLADPETTYALPRGLTAATGIDALTHSLEAFCVPVFNPVCDGIALEALRTIDACLPRAVRDPDDHDARGQLLMAAAMGAIAFGKGLGLCHAMAHPVGAVLGVHHGLANAVLLPHVLAHNASALEAKLDILSRTLGLSGEPAAAADAWLRGLLERVGIEPRLGSVAAHASAHLDELIEKTLEEKLYLATNPRRVDARAVRSVFDAALCG
jgi:alcohol dehydrogenase class IV